MDPEVRGQPMDVIDDDWFSLHLGSAASGVPTGDDVERCVETKEATRRAAATTVHAWLATVDGYRGPADLSISLESAGSAPKAVSLATSLASLDASPTVDRFADRTLGQQAADDAGLGMSITLESVNENACGGLGDEASDPHFQTLDSDEEC